MLVLLSSTSFTFSMHFCMGRMQSMALFKEAKACDMAATAPACATEKRPPGSERMNEKGCCEDHALLIEGQDEVTQTASVSMPGVQMAAVLYAAVSFLFTSASVDKVSFNEYSPPLIGRDIPVLVQSFLI